MVDVPVAPGVREIGLGLNDIVGQFALAQSTPLGGLMLADSETPPFNPMLVTVIVEVAVPPGLMKAGLGGELEMPKSAVTYTVTVIV